jgi:hypothetical protein
VQERQRWELSSYKDAQAILYLAHIRPGAPENEAVMDRWDFYTLLPAFSF